MNKRFIPVLIISLLLSLLGTVRASDAAPIRVLVDGRELTLDVAPILQEGRTLVPLRAIFEALGAVVTWDNATRTVTARRDRTVIQLTIDDVMARVNGTPVRLDVPARIVGERTLAPLRFVSEALGAGVSWDGRARVVYIRQGSVSIMAQPLRVGHPRLLASPEDFARIKTLIAAEPAAARLYANVKSSGEKMLTPPPVEHVLIGPRLLTQSRRALDRVYTLAFLYRVDGQEKWAQRAVREMLAAAAFPDWNPSHWLDVAEMTHALAIGYDWLYDYMTPDQRQTVRDALLKHGLQEADKAYRSRPSWMTGAFNWNNVCNGGIIIGALALADEEPVLAQRLISQAVANLPHALKTYGPDGAWPEGPGYWGYATEYTVAAMASLKSALGTDFGLSEAPGLSGAGLFRLHATGPTDLLFNFADAGEKAGPDASLYWLAGRYDSPLMAYTARQYAAHSRSADAVRSLLWYDARGSAQTLAGASLDARFDGPAQAAFFRSAWADKQAVYVGFKGGDNKVGHAHLDLGTFVMDALGQRWAIDLGADDYNLPDYFGKQRWSYYRLRTEGQNTLVLDGKNQDPRAVAPLTAFRSTAEAAFAIADLTVGYAPNGATRVQRGVALLNGRQSVLIQDEIAAAAPVDVAWSMHTRAQVTVSGSTAVLRQGGVQMTAKLLAPAGASFSTQTVTPDPPQTPLTGVSKLQVRLSEKVSNARIAVLLVPGERTDTTAAVTPLAEWTLP